MRQGPEFWDPDRTVSIPPGESGAGDGPRPAPDVAPLSSGPGPGVAEAFREGGYELLGELGRGGMGMVYLARNVSLDRPCALKTLGATGGDAAASARLIAEAGAVARLKHPNVVQIHRVGEVAGLPFLELEYLPGGSLADASGDAPRHPLEAARMIEAVARAVAEAHRLGIVHRDLSPANILLTGDGEPKVGDFGLARLLDSDAHLTTTGQIVGTPSYMAPEQAEGREAGPAADVYGLGAILYELLVGHPPFRAATALRTLDLARSREPVPPRRTQLGVPRDLETICLKCLEKSPGRRYSDAGALAEDLGRFLRGEPIRARPAGAAERTWKWARRHPAAASLSVGLAATLSVAFILISWQWRRAEGEAVAAARAHREAAKGQAELAMDHGRALCEQGEIGQGMLWLSRSLRLAGEARDDDLARAARVNLAEWSARLGRPLARLRTPAAALDLAFRPDGRQLVALGEDGALRTWDAGSWREETLLATDGGDALVGPVLFDPRDDRTLMAFDGAGRGISWDADRRRSRPLPAAPGRIAVRGAAFLGGGDLLVTCGGDGTLRWRDPATGLPLDGPDRPALGGISALAVSPDGSTLATGGEDGRVVSRDARCGRPLCPPLPHGSPVRKLAFLASGRRVVVLTRDGQVRAWDKASRVATLPPEGAAVASLAVSPDGERFATGTEGGTVRLWDAATLRQSGPTFKHDVAVRSLAFRPDGLALAVGLEDGSIPVWEVPRSGPIAPPRPTRGPARAVAFGRDGEHVLAVGGDGPERWCIGRRAAKCPPPRREHPWGAGRMPDGRGGAAVTAVSPDGRLIASATAGGPAGPRMTLIDADTGAVVAERACSARPPAGIAFSPDSRRFVTWGAGPGTMTLREVGASGPGRALARSLGVAVRHAAFSPDGATLLLGCHDGEARLWDVARDAEVGAGARPFHAYPITAVAFDPRAPRLVTGCHGGTVRLWDRASGTLLCDVRGNAGEVTAVAFSPDGATLLTASLDATARFWDVATGRQLGPPLHHPGAVLSVAFHPDGRSVATGTADGAVWRWRAPMAPIEGEPDRIDEMVRERTKTRLRLR